MDGHKIKQKEPERVLFFVVSLIILHLIIYFKVTTSDMSGLSCMP